MTIKNSTYNDTVKRVRRDACNCIRVSTDFFLFFSFFTLLADAFYLRRV